MDIMPGDQDLTALLERIESNELAQQKRFELSEVSFSMWLQDVFTKIALNLGYTVNRITEFFKTMGYAFKKGYEHGKRWLKHVVILLESE